MEKNWLFVLLRPAQLVWITTIIFLVHRLDSASWVFSTADYLVPVLITDRNLQTNSSAESHIIMRRHTFLILNSNTNEEIGSCRFPALVYSPTVEKLEGTTSHLHRYSLIHYCIC